MVNVTVKDFFLIQLDETPRFWLNQNLNLKKMWKQNLENRANCNEFVAMSRESLLIFQVSKEQMVKH